MSRFPKALTLAALSLAVAGAAAAQTFGLGRAALPEEIAAWDIDIRPDGVGLPEGSGDVATGEELFTEKCAICHGDFGEGAGRWPVLAGGTGTLKAEHPVKTVGSYWPYLSTVYDYVHRAMPFGEAQSLSPDETYALVAYILYLNDIVDDEFTLSKENFLEVEMPNAAGFFADDRAEEPFFGPREICMADCKPDVRITARAAVLDVTPEDGAAPAGVSLDGESAPPPAPAAEPEKKAEAEPVVVAAAEPAPAAFDAALAAEGESLFKKCKACHKVEAGTKHGTGPVLHGVFGAKIGHAEGYKYSKAFAELAESGAVWDEAALHAFLEMPKDFAKGTKMSFAGLKTAEERAAVIEYLRSVSQ